MTTYNDFGGYGHPDHIRAHLVAVGAFERAGDAGWYRDQLAIDQGGDGPPAAEGGLEPWAPSKLYEQAISAGVRRRMTEALEERGISSPWSLPDDATPEQRQEWEDRWVRMTVPDEAITTSVDVGPFLEARELALRAHVTQISASSPFFALGVDGWRELGARETFILRSARVEVAPPESDLFAGLG
jgi:mycothiol S-conjugate amidase